MRAIISVIAVDIILEIDTIEIIAMKELKGIIDMI